MRVFVKAKPGAKHERVDRINAAHFAVWVKAPAEGGAANAAIERLLADYLDVPFSRVRVIKGFTGRAKVVEVT